VKPSPYIAATLLLAASAVRAQDAPAPDPQARPQDARPVPVLTREQTNHIFHVRQMEQMLTNAVKTGATSLATQLQIGNPGSLFATTDARTRGFDLEGYGVFFDVDVPAMLQSVLFTRQTLQDELDSLRQRIRLSNNEDAKRIAAYDVRRLERMLGIPPQPIPGINDGLTQPAPGIAVATNLTETGVALPAPPGAVPTLPRDTRSPDEMYTDAIRDKLIDTMLTFGGGLGIEDDQWLTVAARTTTAGPGQIDDSVSIFIRIKGADLTAFVQRKISRDEVIKRIEIKIG
jgi:hypothetical protein